MKYYTALKTNAVRQGGVKPDDQHELRDWLDIPQHMLEINESAFVPAYGGKSPC